MRSLRKPLIITGTVLATLLVAALLLPFLFRDRIEARLRAEIDSSLRARVAWGSVHLGLLRDFPHASLRLVDASVTGVAPFAGDTLLAVREARLVLSLGSVVRHLMQGGTLEVRDVMLDRPRVALQVLEDGQASWDIMRSDPADTAAGREVEVALRELRIEDGALQLDDRQSRLVARIAGFEQTLEGDFARDRFTIAARTRADSVSVRFAGVPWLNRVAVELDSRVDADRRTNRFTIANDTLRLNELAIAFGGTVAAAGPDTELDLRFAAPGTSFREILSLVPAIYRRDFDALRTTGTMSLSGHVRGNYGDTSFPALTLDARVRDGAFQYPSLPLPARGISLDLAVRNPGGHVDSTVIAVEGFRATFGQRPVAARLAIRTPVSDPDVELALAGTLDLADLARTVKLEDVSTLTGLAAADVAMRTRLSDVDARRYERVAARGNAYLSRVAFRAASLPRPVAIDTVALRLTPQAAELPLLAARVGSSDVRASGALENLLGFALRGDDLRGRASVRSTRFDLADWESAEDSSAAVAIPPRVDLALDVAAAQVVHGPLQATDVRGGIRIRNQRATLDELRMRTLGGGVVASGHYEAIDAARPAFEGLLRMDSLDIATAFATVVTVQKLAPVARWAQGRVSGTAWLRGPLDLQLTPLYDALNGEVAFVTDGLSLRSAPVMDRLGTALALDRLRNPSLGVVRGAFEVASGRVTVKPFVASVAGVDMTVAGSHGIDQTLRYDLALALPRAVLGGATSAAVTAVASRTGGRIGTLGEGEVVQLGAQVTGTVTEPALSLRFAGVASSAREVIADVVRQEVATRAEDVRQRADSALEEARRRARAERDSLVAAAERQAVVLRAEARVLAERVRAEAGTRADSLAARATNPAARMAAQAAADRIRREAEQQAERVLRDADARAEAIVERARREGDAKLPPETDDSSPARAQPR